MARYRFYDRDQAMMVPLSLGEQLQPGTIEHAIDYLVEEEIDLSGFAAHYCNDETGAPAIDPAVLLKVILLAYSRGIVSSRKIAEACCENVVFMALSADTRPHFTTIADFVTGMGEEIVGVFRDVLTVCYSEGLIGGRMFAIDGCKISSNCSKEWSGTKRELEKKAQKIEESLRRLVNKHRREDRGAEERSSWREKEKRAVRSLRAKARKIRTWLDENEERIGTQGKAVKSNITDNQSAKMPSGHGVIQGYNGIATVDAEHQIVVDAQAFGEGHEARRLAEVVESVGQRFRDLEGGTDIYERVVVTADSGFHSEESCRAIFDRGVDGYVADTKFRLRDPRFAEMQSRRKRPDRKGTSVARKYFVAADFQFDESGTLICPAGKPMWCRCPNWRGKSKGYRGKTYQGYLKYCSKCKLRPKCIRRSGSPARQVTKIDRDIPAENKTASQRMIERFDSARGRFYYSRRMGTVEPVFANIRHTMGLNWFTFRGRQKVDTQWKLFCLVHNIGKLARYGSLG
jgi:transposase